MNKVVFLDRDGTINVEKNYLYKIEEFEYIDGAVDALRILQDLGYMLIIITNQSGIARGFYTEADFLQLNHWMIEDLREKGVQIEKVYYCPHHPEGVIAEYSGACDCRKPGTGLFWQAQKELQIDMAKSYAIGDKIRDLAICKESDVHGILLDDREKKSISNRMNAMSGAEQIHSCSNILEAAEWILEYEAGKRDK